MPLPGRQFQIRFKHRFASDQGPVRRNPSLAIMLLINEAMCTAVGCPEMRVYEERPGTNAGCAATRCTLRSATRTLLRKRCAKLTCWSAYTVCTPPRWPRNQTVPGLSLLGFDFAVLTCDARNARYVYWTPYTTRMHNVTRANAHNRPHTHTHTLTHCGMKHRSTRFPNTLCTDSAFSRRCVSQPAENAARCYQARRKPTRRVVHFRTSPKRDRALIRSTSIARPSRARSTAGGSSCLQSQTCTVSARYEDP
eukprot:3939102-Rhodomonas_salina.1